MTIPIVDVREYVVENEETIQGDFESNDGFDDFSEFLSFRTNIATRVGLGKLYLSEVGDASEWFANVSPGWIEDATAKWEFKLEGDKQPRIDRLPWRHLYRALQSAVLSGDEAVIESSATAVRERATAPELDDLPGQEHGHRAWIVRAFAALLLGRDDVPDYLEEARSRLDDDSYHQGYFGSQVDALEGIFEQDEVATREAIEDCLAFHAASFTDNEDMHFVEEVVSADACTFIVLARQRGLDIHVDSEYVPEAVYELA